LGLTELVALLAVIAALVAVAAAVRAHGRAREASLERDEALAAAARPRVAPASDGPFHELLGAVHEAVVIHGERIVLANDRFAALFGRDAAGLVGRHLAELVTSDYADLVADNVRRHLAGDPAAAVYEVEIQTEGGRLNRLELSGTPVRYRGARRWCSRPPR